MRRPIGNRRRPALAPLLGWALLSLTLAAWGVELGTISIPANDGASWGFISTTNTALGAGATATGTDSTALGESARVEIGASGAVALGQGSRATQANTVSVGNTSVKRRLVNLAAGTAASDAATVGQLNAVDVDVSALTGRMTTAEGKITTNASGITANAGGITTNANNITANRNSITTLDNRVGSNTTATAGNASNIASLQRGFSR